MKIKIEIEKEVDFFSVDGVSFVFFVFSTCQNCLEFFWGEKQQKVFKNVILILFRIFLKLINN